MYVRVIKAAVLAVALTVIVNGQEIIATETIVEVITLSDMADCTQYISCNPEADLFGIGRDKNLQCLSLIGPNEVQKDLILFRNFFQDPTLQSYDDVINFGCTFPNIGPKSLPLYYTLKQQKCGTPEEQQRIAQYNNCILTLVKKCKVLADFDVINLQHF